MKEEENEVKTESGKSAQIFYYIQQKFSDRISVKNINLHDNKFKIFEGSVKL